MRVRRARGALRFGGDILSRMKLIARWFLLAAALFGVIPLVSGVRVSSYGAALSAALILGLLNTFVRPVLVLLTLPVTLLSLGLFLFIINALMFWLAGHAIQGFGVESFGAALLGSLLYSVCSIVIDSALQRLWVPREV